MGMLGGFFSSMTSAFTGKDLTAKDLEASLRALRSHLIQKNTGPETADHLVGAVRRQLVGKRLPALGDVQAMAHRALREQISGILHTREIDPLADAKRHRDKTEGREPYVIVFCGINGVGKSTSLAKVCSHLKSNGLSPLIAAGDTFRSGAVQQLEKHARKLGVKVFSRKEKTDPAKVAEFAVREAKEQGNDVVLVDTSGRMQNNAQLMRELARLVVQSKPNLVLFVGEALVGGDGVDQLQTFHNQLLQLTAAEQRSRALERGVDGIFLTKMDTVDDKVGAGLSMVHRTGIPLVFVGVGQRYPDVRRPSPPALVSLLMRPVSAAEAARGATAAGGEAAADLDVDEAMAAGASDGAEGAAGGGGGV